MSGTAHTPGPWSAIKGTSYLDEQPSWIVPGIAHCGDGELSEANARLIAAAPDLLAALLPFEELAGEGNHDQPDDARVTVLAGRSTCYGLTLGDLRRVRAAIAKATGAPNV